jgi:hypothetical protein
VPATSECHEEFQCTHMPLKIHALEAYVARLSLPVWSSPEEIASPGSPSVHPSIPTSARTRPLPCALAARYYTTGIEERSGVRDIGLRESIRASVVLSCALENTGTANYTVSINAYTANDFDFSNTAFRKLNLFPSSGVRFVFCFTTLQLSRL